MPWQRIFRGWRTRCRVVHRVREDMELLVADIQRHLNGEWAMLGPAAATLSSFSLDWGRDGRLRLPRMEDSFFGVSVRFPSVEPEEEQHVENDTDDANEYEQATSVDSGLEDDPLSQDSAMPFESSINSAFEERPPADDTQAVGAQASDTSAEAANSYECDKQVSVVEIRGTTLQAETSAGGEKQQSECQAESMDGVPLQHGNYGNAQLDNVHEILATHSRAEILLELEWARQALRERRKHLRSKRCVERGPNPCACA